MAMGSGSDDGRRRVNPVLRESIRLTLEDREYAYLYKKAFKHLSILRRTLPSSSRYTATLNGVDDFNAATFRISVRCFLALQAGLQVYDIVLSRFFRRGQVSRFEIVLKATGLC